MVHNFITQFHAIEGETIGEKQKNFNGFLKNVTTTPEEKQVLLEKLKPKTYLEKILYVDVLIHLRETNRLWDIFKDGNGVFISKIMKQKWVFQEILDNTDATALVDDILPLLSFSVKIKLLRTLSSFCTEEKIDEVFDCVEKRYGLFVATTLIAACSSAKIEEILKLNNIKLLTPQLKALYKKQPNLINIYLEEQKQYNKEDIFDNKFLTYLAQSDPEYFWDLVEKHNITNNITLGRRTTKKLIPLKTQEMIKDPKKYIKYLKHDALVRKLNKQGNFKQFYYNLFPKNIDVVGNTSALCNSVLKFYPKSHQYNLFTTTFNDIMKEDIWNYTCFIHDDLLKFVPDNEVRENWALLKYKESNNEKYLKFYKTQKALTLIKEKINTTSAIKSRSKLISMLVESCAISKDLKALEEVLKYFCDRHRNDSKITRNEFLEAIESNFDLEKLSHIHWKYISEIFTIQSLNQGYGAYNSKLRIKHIEFLFNNGGSEEEKTYFILEYLKEQVLRFALDFSVLNKIKNTDLQKTILLEAVKHVDTIIKTQNKENDRPFLKSQLLAKIFSFNMRNPENEIKLEEDDKLLADLRHILDESSYVSYPFGAALAQIICKVNRNELQNEMLKHYFSDKTRIGFNFRKTMWWFLQHDPAVIVNYFNEVMEEFMDDFTPFRIMSVIKRYSHLSLDDKVIQYSLHQLKQGNHQPKYIQSLSMLCSPEYYIQIIEDLNVIPASLKLLVEDTEARKLFEIQKSFAENFRHTWNPQKYLPLLLDKFVQGDYLEGSLPSLYFAFHNIPENELQVYLEKIYNNNAISVKKHALFLASRVLNQQKVLEISKNFEQSKNVSLQKCLCLSSLKYFLKNPNQDNFEKVLSYMTFLKQLDTESLKILTSVHIPKSYRALYIISLWNLLENLKVKDDAVGFGALLSAVLENIHTEDISNLPSGFCKAIISNYFGKNVEQSDQKVSGIYQFIIKFLLNPKNQIDNFTYVFTLLSNYKIQFWDVNGSKQELIYNFFNTFYTLSCKTEEKGINLDFVNKFFKEWEKIFSPKDTFKEYVLLNLLKFKKEAEDDFELFSKQIVLFAEEIDIKYGGIVLSKFVQILSQFNIFVNKNEERIRLLTQMLKFKTSTLCCILVMELILIKGDLLYKNRIRPTYREIDSLLRQSTELKVQLYYNMYLRND